jgi:hypothetical protein
MSLIEFLRKHGMPLGVLIKGCAAYFTYDALAQIAATPRKVVSNFEQESSQAKTFISRADGLSSARFEIKERDTTFLREVPVPNHTPYTDTVA